MLPAVRTEEEWQAVVFDETTVRPAAEDLAARLGPAGAGLRRYPGGSRPVYAVGDRRVLKLYPTVSGPDSRTEARVLDYLSGRLPVATPELLAHGEYENGWHYVLMSRLPGTELADWAGFLAGQRATAVRRQRAVRLPDPWLGQIEGFLGAAPLTPGRGRVLLHTEVTREHLVASPGPWTLSGLLDFETAMTGDRAYEFAAAGLFVSRGDPRLPGRILAAYGHSFDPRELLAYTLLHRHSNLPECLSQLPAPPEPELDSLAQAWFCTA
jgi:hygromycin-B 7''-O-kinase